MIIELVKTFLIHFTYLALVAVLVAAGLGVPIPEDVPLAFSGYLCHEDVSPVKSVLMIDSDGDGVADTLPAGSEKRVPHLPIMILAGMIGVLSGDTIVFFIGRHGVSSNNFVARHIRKVLTTKRRERVEAHFRKHGALTVFAGRFMPGLRSPVFAMAGLSHMSLGRFLLVDGMAAAISVPVFVLLGYHFAHEIDGFFKFLDRVKLVALPLFITALAVAIALYMLRRNRRKTLEMAAAPAEPCRIAPVLHPVSTK